ncbi:sulfotransferase [Candidatus Pelagibacter sp.]|jgi:hypothetical protein|nr:sulfotransferase [Candidatus Pelagibacter sp.]
MFKDKFFGSPIFISGWVKSGTGIFLRLFDNHENIHCPHGEGKLGIVREHLNLDESHYDSKIKIHDILIKFVSLYTDSDSFNLKHERYVKQKYSFIIKKKLERIKKLNKKNAIKILISTMVEISKKKKTQKSRWVEKNHNLEFFFEKLKKSFSNPNLLIVCRDPRAAFLSYCRMLKKYNITNTMNEFNLIVKSYFFYEIDNYFLGNERFKSIDQLCKYFLIKKKLGLNQYEIWLNKKKPKYLKSENIFTKSHWNRSKTLVKRYSILYNIISDRQRWLAKKYNKSVLLIPYEKLIGKHQEIMNKVFLKLKLNKIKKTLQPINVGKKFSTNSNFKKEIPDELKNVIYKSHTFWKKKLSKNEINVITKMSMPSYRSSVRFFNKLFNKS